MRYLGEHENIVTLEDLFCDEVGVASNYFSHFFFFYREENELVCWCVRTVVVVRRGFVAGNEGGRFCVVLVTYKYLYQYGPDATMSTAD